MKESIKINNSQLVKLITESIKNVLKEDEFGGRDFKKEDSNNIKSYIWEIKSFLDQIQEPYSDRNNLRIVNDILYDAQKLEELIGNYWMNEQ